MHDFHYVPKEVTKPIKKELCELIHKVQNIAREQFTFTYSFIGSSSRNMITMDTKSNIGFDFDVNIEVNDKDENYSPDKIRHIIKNALDRVAYQYGYKFCEDSTRVLTIKMVDRLNSRIIHSCDLAIVNNCNDGRQQYIRFNKSDNTYCWDYQGKGFEDFDNKINWLKKNKYWQELRDYYLDKKNINNDPRKHSRSIFYESIHEMCVKNYY